MNSVISRTSQWSALSRRALSAASTCAESPSVLKIQVPISFSLTRSSMIASSRSRHIANGQKAAPCASIPATSDGGASAGAEIVMVAVANSRSMSTVSVSYPIRSSSIDLFKGVSSMPLASAGRSLSAANSAARSATASSNLERGITSSTRSQSVVRLPRMPSRRGAEIIGAVVADLPFVNQPGQPASARENGQQRQFRKRHRGRAVVDQHDVVAGKRELVSAAGAGAVDGGKETNAGIVGRVLDPIARLVGELAEIHFVRMGRLRQHPDICAGAENAILVGRHDDGADFRVFEPDPLQRVVKLDIDSEVVGIKLQLIARHQGRFFVHVQREPRDASVKCQIPVMVFVRAGPEVDPRLARRCFFGRIGRHSASKMSPLLRELPGNPGKSK